MATEKETKECMEYWKRMLSEQQFKPEDKGQSEYCAYPNEE
jgi:hypothetical protein